MIDVKQQISDVRRTLGRRVLEAGEARVSTISQVYDTGLDDLWDAVTSADRIRRWFMPVTGDLTEGGRYQLEGNAGGTVTACDKPHGFAATWEYGDQVSWIEVRLTPAGDGATRFELEHVAHVADEMWDQYGPSATGIGWDSGLLGLANHLAAPGTELEPGTAAAWVATTEGTEFMRLSSEAWRETDVADGADPAAAAERAQRTFAAYTGG